MIKPEAIPPSAPSGEADAERCSAGQDQAMPPSNAPGAISAISAPASSRMKWLAGLVAVLMLCFAGPLYTLIRFALHNDLYSHILLVPFISLYLIWLKRSELDLQSAPDRRLAVIPLFGAAALVVAGVALHKSTGHAIEDYLSACVGAFYFFLIGACCLLLGKRTLRAIGFPLAFLIFMVPFPEFVHRAIESFLQQGSAQTAYMLLELSGMPVFRQGTQFQLPGFSMEVAPQCSGIHSSLVLFISSFLAGHLLLSSRAARLVVLLAILPLALLRNGFRIFVLAQLCVRVNPDWINSDLHHRGGPVFFALSLIPFLALLFLLRKWEQRKTHSKV